MDKISIQELTDIVASHTGQTKKFSEQFLRELVNVISEYLLRDGIVKVKGLGTFKIITVEERKSVDVTSGREIVLPAHNKVQFTPEDAVKQAVNEPYSHLQTTVLDNPVEDDGSDVKTSMKDKETISESPVETDELVGDDTPDGADNNEEQIPHETDDEQTEGRSSNTIWWWIGGFILVDLLLILYFTMPNWKPALTAMFDKTESPEPIVAVADTISEEEELAKEQAYADSLLAFADSMLVQYQDSVSNAIVEDYMPEQEAKAEPVANIQPTKFDIDSYDYKMAMEAPVREVVTVIDGSRLTMVAYRAYGHKDFWVYVYDANRDVLRRPSGIAKGMSLKIADLPAELVDPNSDEALAKAHELAKKYSK